MVSSQLQPQAEAENLISTASLSLEWRLTGSELEEKETKAIHILPNSHTSPRKYLISQNIFLK